MPYTPYGPKDYSLHLLHVCLQLYFVSSYMILQATCLSLFFGVFYYIRAFCVDFRLLIDRVDNELKAKSENVNNLIIEAIKFERDIVK